MSIRLTIPEPCHESWQNMQPNKEGRHCLSCRKTVVDFSMMTDKEILDYITAANGNVCGRFDTHQLDRNMKEAGWRKKWSWIYIWNLLIIGLLWTGRAKAQGSPVVKMDKEEKYPRLMGKVNPLKLKPAGIPITIVNENTGEPVPFASISLNEVMIASADSSGKLFLPKPRTDVLEELTISAVGFTSQTILLGTDNPGVLTVYLKPEAAVLDEVVVSSGDCRKTLILGGMTGVRIISGYEQFTRDWFPSKNVLTYPNPISRGNTLNVSLQLKEAGQYRFELIDGGGKIIWMQSMNIPSSKYNFSIPTQPAWSAGIYYLRVSGRQRKQVYNNKVVIQ